MRYIFFSLLFLSLAAIASGQATLRIGDFVDLKISGVPADDQTQINTTYTVDGTGSISLPYISKVKAVGLTPAQLAASVESAFRTAKIYTNPTITISMPPSLRFVNIGGAVRAAGRLPFTEDMTLLTAINAAGGFNDFADQRHVRLLRGNKVTIYDVRKFRRDPSLDVAVQPGDKIEVPQSFF